MSGVEQQGFQLLKFHPHDFPYFPAFWRRALFVVEGVFYRFGYSLCALLTIGVEYHGTKLPKRHHLLNSADFLSDLSRKGKRVGVGSRA